jgi:membrane protease YdiL (CAAX protease family)
MSVAGLVAAWVAAGRPGLTSLLRRAIQLRPAGMWALYALLLPLAWETVSALAWGLTHAGVGRFEPAGLLRAVTVPALIALTTGPIGEEFGWRGYLLPRFLRRFSSPIGATLVLGVLWSIWHYPLYWNSVFATVAGGLNFTISVLCFSVLMTVLFAFTRGSVFWAIVMHWTVNTAEPTVQAMFPDLRTDGADLLNVGVLVLVTVAVVLAVGRTRLQRELALTLEGLGPESIDADRVASPARGSGIAEPA